MESDGDDTYGSLRRVLDALSCVPWPQVCVEACYAATMLASAPPLSATVLFVQMRQKSSTTAHHAVMEFERSFDASKEADALSASALARTDGHVVESSGDEDEDEMRSFETLMSSMLKERASPHHSNRMLPCLRIAHSCMAARPVFVLASDLLVAWTALLDFVRPKGKWTAQTGTGWPRL